MQSGSQATRDAADIVLLHDSFGALPGAFREGQRIRRGLCRILELFLTRVFTVALIILAVLVVLGGLVLVLFAAPPGPWFAVVEDMDGDRRPAYVALAMVPIYAIIMSVPALREFFGMRGKMTVDFGIIVLVVLIWMYVLRWVWEARIFDRFFGYDTTERPVERPVRGKAS